MLTTLPTSCAVVMKSGNLNFLESSGPLQACNGTALPFLHSIGLYASFSIPLRYSNYRQSTVDDVIYEHIGLCFFVLRWLRFCGIHISLRKFRSVTCYHFSSVPRGFYAVLAKGYKRVVHKNTLTASFSL